MSLQPSANVLDRSFSSNVSKTTALFGAFLLFGLVAIMYAPVVSSMARQWWDDPNYGHGPLVPMFALFILWRERGRWSAAEVRGCNYGLGIMLSAFCLLILGMLSAEHFTSRVSLLVLISGIIVFLAGWQVLRAIAFPVGYLFLMIPLPALVYYQLTFPLQLWASRIGARGLDMLGVHAIREGNLLILPNITFEVVDACSGVRSLISLLAAVIAYGYLVEDSVWRRCFVVVLTIPIVILSNGLRLVVAVVLSSVYGLEADSGGLHTILGLVFIVVAFLSIIFIHRALRHFTSARIPTPAH